MPELINDPVIVLELNFLIFIFKVRAVFIFLVQIAQVLFRLLVVSSSLITSAYFVCVFLLVIFDNNLTENLTLFFRAIFKKKLLYIYCKRLEQIWFYLKTIFHLTNRLIIAAMLLLLWSAGVYGL